LTIRFTKNKAKNSAEILIYADVGESWWGDGVTAKSFHDELKALGDVATIDVRINSYGGDVFDGLAIHRQLVEHKATVTTHVDGIAASIASVIAMAGERIEISESGFLMIHDAWTIAIGNAEELRAVADRVDATSANIADLYAARCGKSVAQVRDWMKAETWFNGKDAVAAGLCDAIAENVRVAARSRPDWAKFRNTPAIEAPAVSPVSTPLKDYLASKVAERRTALTARQAASGRG
jgi:ATP-dependent Clp protease, protease subunit